MKRILTALLFLMGLVALLTLGASAEEDKTATFYNGDAVQATATADENGNLLLPSCPTNDKKFVGWITDTADGTKLLGAGSTVALSAGNTDFRAVLVELKTLTGAAVSINAPTTLRFDGAVSVNDLAALAELVGSEQISLGILIAPANRIQNVLFQKECGVEGLLDRTNGIAYTTDTYHVFSGRTETILDEELLESFAARAYLSVTTPDGDITVYADYDSEKHQRMAHFVTAKAFEDRTPTADSSHVYTTEQVQNYYAIYTEATLASLEDRLDKVISVSDGWGSEPYVDNEYAKSIYNYPVSTCIQYVFYTSPYYVGRVIADGPNYYTSTEVDINQKGYETYVIVAKEGANINNVKTYLLGEAHRAPLASEWREDGIYLSVRNHVSY